MKKEITKAMGSTIYEPLPIYLGLLKYRNERITFQDLQEICKAYNFNLKGHCQKNNIDYKKIKGDK